jgi:hypothetical protein
MAAKRNGKPRRLGRLSDEELDRIFQAAFVHCLEVTDTSQARAANSMITARSTVEAYLNGESPVNAKRVMRSERLWRPFWLCVGKLMHRARKVA